MTYKENLSEGAEKFVRDVAQRYNTLVFLDKSARPFAGLFKERYKKVYPDKPLPEIKFVSIGREKPGKYGGRGRYGALVSEGVKRLRKSFSRQDDSSYFDGKRILLIDEFVSSGGTIKNAEEYFLSAFPKARSISKATLSGDSRREDGILGPYITTRYDELSAFPEAVYEKSDEDFLVSPMNRGGLLKIRERLEKLLEASNKRSISGRVSDFFHTINGRTVFRSSGFGKIVEYPSDRIRFSLQEDGKSYQFSTFDKEKRKNRTVEESEILKHPRTYKKAVEKALEKVYEKIDHIDRSREARTYLKKIGRGEYDKAGQEVHNQTNSLETTLAAASLTTFLVSLIFLSSNITGNVTGLNHNSTSFIGVGLFLLGIVLAFWYNKIK